MLSPEPLVSDARGIRGMVYASLKNNEFYNSKFIRNSDAFKSEADVIISNSNTEALADVAAKVYTHNLFGSDS